MREVGARLLQQLRDLPGLSEAAIDGAVEARKLKLDPTHNVMTRSQLGQYYTLMLHSRTAIGLKPLGFEPRNVEESPLLAPPKDLAGICVGLQVIRGSVSQSTVRISERERLNYRRRASVNAAILGCSAGSGMLPGIDWLGAFSDSGLYGWLVADYSSEFVSVWLALPTEISRRGGSMCCHPEHITCLGERTFGVVTTPVEPVRTSPPMKPDVTPREIESDEQAQDE